MLTELIAKFNTYAAINPMVAGAVSLWALSTLTFLCRGVPTAIWTFVAKQCTTTLSFNNSGYGNAVDNFASFLVWFEKNKWSKYARSVSMDVSFDLNTNHAMVTGVGSGIHFFIYKRRLFILHRYTQEKAGTDKLIYIIHITMLGRDKEVIAALIDDFSFKLPENKTKIWGITYRDDEWQVISVADNRNLSTVIVDAEIKDKLVQTIESFKASKDWYTARGLAYKKTYILHGIPGTGKTSLIKALACHFKMGLCIININDMSDAKLEKALSKVPKNCVVVIEDFDSAKATKQRNSHHNTIPGRSPGEKTESIEHLQPQLDFDIGLLTLSGILNALDGIVTLNDKLIFLTTNVLDTIDSALIRKGRVDYIFELKALRDKEVREYVTLMFPGTEISTNILFDDIVGCDLQSLYFEYPDSVADFVESIPKTVLFPSSTLALPNP